MEPAVRRLGQSQLGRDGMNGIVDVDRLALLREALGTPSSAWSMRSPAVTAIFMPSRSKVTGRRSTPANSPTSGPSAAIGPPAAPVAIWP
jgi:hypothetical protein